MQEKDPVASPQSPVISQPEKGCFDRTSAVSQSIRYLKIVSEYDQEIPQSQTADNPVAPRGRAAQPSQTPGRQIKQSNQRSLPHQDDCNARMDIK